MSANDIILKNSEGRSQQTLTFETTPKPDLEFLINLGNATTDQIVQWDYADMLGRKTYQM